MGVESDTESSSASSSSGSTSSSEKKKRESGSDSETSSTSPSQSGSEKKNKKSESESEDSGSSDSESQAKQNAASQDSDAREKSAVTIAEDTADDDISHYHEAPYTGKKEAFSEMPQSTLFKSTVQPSAFTDPYLRSLQDNIFRLQEHVLKIQNEEVELLNSFPKLAEKFEKGNQDQTEKQRSEFINKLEKIRKARKHFRGLLYDAVQQRNGIVKSYDIHRAKNKEQELQEENLGTKTGVDSFFIAFGVLQTAIVICFIIFFDYSHDVVDAPLDESPRAIGYYSAYLNICLMVFLGYGYYYTSPSRNSFSGAGTSILVSAYAIEFGILILGFFHYADIEDFGKIELTIPHIIDGAYVAACVLVTYGSVLGRVNVKQFILFATIEIIFYGLNYYIGFGLLHAVDPGMSMFVHTFGAVFGLALAFIINVGRSKYDKGELPEHASRYRSDSWALFGTLFLWVLWPSFNAAFSPDGLQVVSAVNTVLALTGSCLAATYTSYFFASTFSPEILRSASLAGGVFIGSAISFISYPWVSIVLGALVGVAVTLFKLYIHPLLESKLGARDSCGTFYLHGFAGIISAILAMIAIRTEEDRKKDDGDTIWGVNYYDIFPEGGDQSQLQLATLIITVGIALGSGILAGLLVRFLPFVQSTTPNFSDSRDWQTPGDFNPVAPAPVEKK